MPRSAEPCFYCGEQTVRALVQGPMSRTRDHVVPLALGGLNRADNQVIACGWCNSTKADMFHHEWVTWLACINTKLRGKTFRRKASLVLSRWSVMVTESTVTMGRHAAKARWCTIHNRNTHSVDATWCTHGAPGVCRMAQVAIVELS